MEEDIITDLTVLQGCVDKLISHSEQCDFALQQFRAFQLTLFAANSLPEMIEHVLEQTRSFFSLEQSSLVLIDVDAKIASYLAESGYDYQKNQQLILLPAKTGLADVLTHTPFIGRYDSPQHSLLFPEQDEPPLEVMVIPLLRRGDYLGSLNLSSHHLNGLRNKSKLNFVEQLASSIAICLENHLNFALAQQAYRTEVLAKSNNRHFLEKRLTEEVERGLRATSSLVCVLCEVNFPPFKNSSDKMQLETQVLKTAAETIRRQLRISDVFSYYEGRKFAAFLNNVPETVISEITRRINTALEEQVINFAQQIIPLSVIFGTASYQISPCPTEKSPQEIALELMASADATLYAAKYQTTAVGKKSPHR